MANEVIINIPGIGDVVAENAATEATLRDILAAIKANGGGTNAGGGTSQNSGANNAQRDAQGKLKTFGNAIAGVTSATVGLTGSIVKMTMSTGGLIKRFADLDGSVTSAAYEIRDLTRQIPIIGEHLQGLGKAITAVASAQDELVGSFQKASTVGATFAGSIVQFSAQASAAGMTIRDYSQFVASNGEAMRALGGTTEAGTKRFAILSKALQDSSSGLYALGLSTADINAGLASYAKLTQYNANIRKKTDADLIASTRAYIKELDITAKMTGQSREQISGEMSKNAIDAQFRSMIDSMGERGADVETTINSMLVQLGPLMGGYAKEIGAVGVPVSETNQQMAFALGQTTTALTNYFNAAKNPAYSDKQLAEMGGNILNIARKELGGYSSSELGGQVTAATPELMNLRNAATQVASSFENARKQAIAEQEPVYKMEKSMQEMFNRFGIQITNVSNKFKNMLASNGVFDLLTHAFNGISKFIDKVTVPQFDNFGKIISGITKKATELGGPLFDKLMEMVDYIPDMISTIFKTVFGDSTSGVTSTLQTALNEMIQRISGFNEDVSKMSPEEIRDAITNWAVTSIEHGVNTIQTLWYDLQLELVSHIKVSMLSFILNIGNYGDLSAVYLGQFVDYLKIGAQGLQVGIDSVVNVWHSIENQFDVIAIGMSRFADLFNYLKAIDPTRTNYTMEDYKREYAANEEYRSKLKAEMTENVSYTAESSTRETEYNKKLAEFRSNQLDTEKEKKEIEDKIAQKKQSVESEYTKILGSYTDELNTNKQRLLTERAEQDRTRADRIAGNVGGPMTNEYNKQAGALSSQASAINSMAGQSAIGLARGYTGSPIKGLTLDQTRALAGSIAQRESAGKLGIQNPEGYTGLYQMGASSLVEAGLISREKYKAANKKNWYDTGGHKAFINDPSNWISSSPEEFKTSRSIQDKAWQTITNKNIDWGNLSPNSTPEQIAGFAASSQFGIKRAKLLAEQGVSTTDKYGKVTTKDYYNLGSNAMHGKLIESIRQKEQEKQREIADRKQSEQEANEKRQSEQADPNMVKSSFSPTAHTDLLERVADALDRLNLTSENMLSTHEKHVNIAQAQSGNLYA